MFRVTSKLKRLKGILKNINKEGFYDIKAAETKAYQTLQQVQDDLAKDVRNHELIKQEKAALEAYNQAHQNNILFLRQKTKLNWLAYGDESTKVFYQSLKSRSTRNRINSIYNDDDEWICITKGVEEAFLLYYKNLFWNSKQDTLHVNQQIIDQGPKITEIHIGILQMQVTKEKVRQAIFSIPNDKSPSLDGYNSFFFKKNWDILGDEVCSAIMEFFSTRKLLKEINVTSITLIPKVSCPKGVGDYRPIACCSVLYKCLTKIIANRLNSVLPDIISCNQGAFMKGRSILQNILVCHDIVKIYRKANKRNAA